MADHKDDDDADELTMMTPTRRLLDYVKGYRTWDTVRYSMLIEYPLLYYQCMRRN